MRPALFARQGPAYLETRTAVQAPNATMPRGRFPSAGMVATLQGTNLSFSRQLFVSSKQVKQSLVWIISLCTCAVQYCVGQARQKC